MSETKRKVCRVLGYLLCILPATLSALEHFPLWLGKTESCLSLLCILLLALCLWPLKRGLERVQKNPSAWVLWLCLFVFLKVTLPLAQGLFAVAGVALPFSLLGAVFFRLSRRGVKESERND